MHLPHSLHPTLPVRLITALTLAGLAMTAVSAWQATSRGRLVYIGTYTGPTTQSKGIYAFRFDEATGALSPLGLQAETTNPSFLAAAPSGRVIYAVNEIGEFNGAKAGSVTSFSVDPATARLTSLGAESTGGGAPCHVQCDRSGRFAAVANYSGGNFALYPVGADGRLGPSTALLASTGSGPDKARQKGPHAHQVVFDPTNQFLLGVDLGTDQILIYRFDQVSGKVTPHDPPSARVTPGSGPRHLTFHPNGRFVFAINELSSTVTSFAWDVSKGTLTALGTQSTLPTGATGANSTAEIAAHPNGRFLYGSNRGHDSIVVFTIAPDGALALVEHEPTQGKNPRNFAIDPTGRWLIAANQGSGSLAVFRIDEKTGALSPVGPLASVGAPVSVLFMP